MSDQKFIVIGDGIAGATAAEELRENNEEAEIHVFTDESEPLYNRIMLKTYMKGRLPRQYARVHDTDWYSDRDIELHLDTRVEEIDLEKNQIEATNGEYSYDKLLVATGGSPENFRSTADLITSTTCGRLKTPKTSKRALKTAALL